MLIQFVAYSKFWYCDRPTKNRPRMQKGFVKAAFIVAESDPFSSHLYVRLSSHYLNIVFKKKKIKLAHRPMLLLQFINQSQFRDLRKTINKTFRLINVVVGTARKEKNIHRNVYWMFREVRACTMHSWSSTILPYFGKRKQVTYHPIWVIDVFIIHLMSSSSRLNFMQKHSSVLRDM